MSRSMEPTPQAMPNMVRNERSLLARMAINTWPKVSPRLCIRLLSDTRMEGSGFPCPVLPDRRLGEVDGNREWDGICDERGCSRDRSHKNDLGRAPAEIDHRGRARWRLKHFGGA